MEENIRYGFWDQFPISFFQPKKYKVLLPVKKRILIPFILIIVGLTFFMETLMPFAAWDISMGGFDNVIENTVPKFKLENGILDMDGPLEMNLSNAIHLKVNSEVEEFSKKDLQEKYVEEILISRTNFVFKHNQMVSVMKLSDLGIKGDNQTLMSLVPTFKLAAFLCFITFYIIDLGRYLIFLLFFAMLFRMRTREGKRISFGESFAITAYARAPFALLTSVNMALGYVINSLAVTVVGVFLTIRYIYWAQASILKEDEASEDNSIFG